MCGIKGIGDGVAFFVSSDRLMRRTGEKCGDVIHSKSTVFGLMESIHRCSFETASSSFSGFS
jgi:hypothetical protein